MPWNKNNYPDSMKNLDEEVRKKAIEIANALLGGTSDFYRYFSGKKSNTW